MIHATARRSEGLAHTVVVDGHETSFDEPLDAGGTDTAPSPTRMLAAALAACVAMTIRLYADRKGWDVDGLEVDVDFPGPPRAGDGTSFAVAVTLPAGLDDEQRERIMVIAGKCPVHRILSSDVEIVTTERPAAS